MNARAIHALSLTGMLVALTGCGGSPQVAGIEGSGIDTGPLAITSAGAVTALGSIFVNGVEYDLSGAEITLDGAPAGESDLDVGSIVIVEGELGEDGMTGDAIRVTAGIALAGPIAAIDVVEERFTLLGQTVQIDPLTIIEGGVTTLPLGGLLVGDDVEVTGFADSTGSWTARRIAPRDPDSPLRLTGRVADLNAGASRFAIGAQSVDYAAASLTDFEGRSLAGAYVRVSADELDANETVIATEIAYIDPRLPGSTGDIVALQGWVTRFVSAADFDVDGHPVVTTTRTVVIGPEGERRELGEIRLDAFVNVSGHLLDGGIVLAAEIRTNTLISLDSIVMVVDGEPGERFVRGALWAAASFECLLRPETVIRVDGLPGGVDDIAHGDIATVYETHEVLVLDEEMLIKQPRSYCQIVDVQHAIRGPIDELPADRAWLTVMGQRVWLDTTAPHGAPYEFVADFSALDGLGVGDVVEVGGHLTADGEIIARSIHASRASRNYRVTGLARNVDPVFQRFDLGELTVYFGSGGLGGFAAGIPAEGDRVVVESTQGPGGGSLTASLVRFDGGVPRGATMNIVKLNGFVTRFESPEVFEVSGRRTIPVPTPFDPIDLANPRCDMNKVHVNMPFERLVAVGNLPGEPPVYFLPLCPFGRRVDENWNDIWHFSQPAPLVVAGPVQSVDFVNGRLGVAGLDLALLPTTLLTRFDLPPEGSLDVLGEPLNYVSTPASLDELAIGDRVHVLAYEPPTSAARWTVQSVWSGDAVPAPDAGIRLSATLQAGSEPVLSLAPGIEVATLATTEFVGEAYGESFPYEPAEFWANVLEHLPGQQITVFGYMSGSELVAERVTFTDPFYVYEYDYY